MKAIKVINRFIVDYDHLMYDTLHVIDNKSIWRKLFKFTINYAGSITRSKTKEIVNNKMIELDVFIITYFVKDKVNVYNIRFENGIIRESDMIFNSDFENALLHLENLICKHNLYSKLAYAEYKKKLKKELRK